MRISNMLQIELLLLLVCWFRRCAYNSAIQLEGIKLLKCYGALWDRVMHLLHRGQWRVIKPCCWLTKSHTMTISLVELPLLLGSRAAGSLSCFLDNWFIWTLTSVSKEASEQLFASFPVADSLPCWNVDLACWIRAALGTKQRDAAMPRCTR